MRFFLLLENRLGVEGKVRVRFLHVGPVPLLKVLGQDHVAVLAHGVHPCLLADRRDVGVGDLFFFFFFLSLRKK